MSSETEPFNHTECIHSTDPISTRLIIALIAEAVCIIVFIYSLFHDSHNLMLGGLIASGIAFFNVICQIIHTIRILNRK